MGDSFGDVQIHTGAQAAAACESINARAFTVGNHIAFNTGEYDPESTEGQHVVAHELTHVRQQTGGAVSLLPQEDLELEIDPDPALEREAEETAQRVVHGWKADIQRMPYTGVHIQRVSRQTRFDEDGNIKLGDEDASETIDQIVATIERATLLADHKNSSQEVHDTLSELVETDKLDTRRLGKFLDDLKSLLANDVLGSARLYTTLRAL